MYAESIPGSPIVWRNRLGLNEVREVTLEYGRGRGR
jgi:hypothetical protein